MKKKKLTEIQKSKLSLLVCYTLFLYFSYLSYILLKLFSISLKIVVNVSAFNKVTPQEAVGLYVLWYIILFGSITVLFKWMMPILSKLLTQCIKEFKKK